MGKVVTATTAGGAWSLVGQQTTVPVLSFQPTARRLTLPDPRKVTGRSRQTNYSTMTISAAFGRIITALVAAQAALHTAYARARAPRMTEGWDNPRAIRAQPQATASLVRASGQLSCRSASTVGPLDDSVNAPALALITVVDMLINDVALLLVQFRCVEGKPLIRVKGSCPLH